MTDPRVQLSKAVAHALRHDPDRYRIELDAEGWTSVDALLAGLRERSRWRDVDRTDLGELVRHSAKQRFEINGERIRALYGHSVPGRIVRPLARPPDLLLHGTTSAALPAIRADGLRPMGRQYVHLSVDRDTATAVGRRKGRDVVVLQVAASDAHEVGIGFWRGNESVWLADCIPRNFIREN